jgi:tetratricopeptide (TPR) repeat protein
MSWNEGYFSFTEGDTIDLPADTTVRIPVEALLMEGARRIDEWSRIEKRVPHLGVVPTFAPAPDGTQADLDLLPAEWEVLALVDGDRDVHGLASALGRSDFDVAKTVFGLESAGIVVLVDPGARAGPGGAAALEFEQLVAHAEEALQAKDWDRARAAAEQAAGTSPHDPVVHLLLGRIHLAAGRAADAVEELRRTIRLDPLLPAPYRLIGYALVTLGRFGEALEQWTHWERLAPRSEEELELTPEVERARDAARVLSGTGSHG